MPYSDGPVPLAWLPAAVVLILLLGFAVDYFTVLKPSGFPRAGGAPASGLSPR